MSEREEQEPKAIYKEWNSYEGKNRKPITLYKNREEQKNQNPMSEGKKNQSPKGIIWSAIPLPCFSNRYKVILLGYPFGGRAAAPIGDEVL